MALTVIPLSGLASDVVDSISAGAGGGGPRIANVQIANSSWGLLDDTAVSTDGGYVLINGSGFVSGCSVLVANSQATPVTFANSSLLRVEVPAKSASTYAVYVLNPDGGTAIGINALTYSAFPAWATGSTLSSGSVDAEISVQLSASEATTYTLQAGSSLPANTTLASNGLFSGTITGINEETTYTFTVEATDAQNQNTPRTFSITITVGDSNFKSTTILLNTDANTYVRDASNNAFAITVNGDTRPSAFSPYNTNWSNFFDGTGDYLSVDSNAAFGVGSGNFTIECWIYLTQNFDATGQGIVTASYNTNFAVIGVNSGAGNKIDFYVVNTILTTGTNYIGLNVWTHLAFVRSSGTTSIYFNGVQVASSGSLTGTGAAAALYVGTLSHLLTQEMTGYISNLRLVKGTAVYTSNFTPPSSSLTAIANTSLLTCQSNRFIDNSTNAFTITKNDDTKVSAFGPFTETDTITGSAYFDGTGDFLDPTTSNSAFSFDTGNFTVEAWIYPNSLSNYMGIVGQAITSADTQHSFFVFANGQVTHQSYFAVGLATTTSNITTGMWHHVAAVRSGANGAIFINGVRAASNTAYTKNYSNTNPIRIGAAAEAGSTVFNGYISNARVVKGTAVYDPTQSTITVPDTSFTAVANTQLLTLQNRTGITNHQYVDESGINSIITRNGNASQGSFSPYSPAGWSGYFDGSGDYFSVADNAALTMGASSFTIEGWFYPLNYTGTDKIIILHRPVTTARGIVLAFSQTTGTPFVLAGDTDNAAWNVSLTSSTAATLNAWNHVAFTRNSSTWNIWLNGTSVASNTASFTVDDTSTLYLFANLDGSSGFPGYISNFRIIKGNALYTSNFTPSTTPLTPVANTSLLILRGNSFADDSPNRLAITRNGDVKIESFSPFQSHTITSNTHSVYFDRTGQLDVPESAISGVGSSNFSIECWVYATIQTNTFAQGLVSYGVFGSTTGTSYLSFQLSSSGNLAVAYAVGSSLTLSDPSLFPLNQWVHAVVCRSGSTLSLFLNGTRVATTTTSATVGSSGDVLAIGGQWYADISGRRLQGYISNVRIVNGSSAYNATLTTLTVPTTPLTNITNTSLLTCQSNLLIDNSTNAFTITAAGNVTPSILNPFGETINSIVEYSSNAHGGSSYFDGTGDFLTAPNNAAFNLGSSDATIEVWIYPTSSGQTRGIIDKRSNSANYSQFPQIALVSGVLYAYVSYSGSAWAGTIIGATPVINAWTHVALVRSGNTWTLYVNGAVSGTPFTAAGSVYVLTDSLVIGASTSSGVNPFIGYISNLRVIKGTAYYTSAFTPPTTPPNAIKGTVLLLDNVHGGIRDVSSRNILECVGNVRVSTDTKKYGTGSMYFDGTGDYLLPPPSQNFAFRTGDFTIELWIKTSSTADDGILQISTTAGGFATSYTNGLMIAIVSGTVYWALNGSSVNTSTSFNDGNWHHLAMTRSGSTVRVFKNGTQISTATNAGDVQGTNLVIGGYYTTSYTLEGYIDDLRITKGVARYTTNFTAPTSAHPTR